MEFTVELKLKTVMVSIKLLLIGISFFGNGHKSRLQVLRIVIKWRESEIMKMRKKKVKDSLMTAPWVELKK